MITPNLCTLNILLADDGSEHSKAAVELLGELPLDESSKIKALRVFTPSDIADVWLLERTLKLTEDALKKHGKQVESEIVLGHPAEKIIEEAEKYQASMIVMGAKGLRATLGILLGGVVQQVTEHAQLPVMVVRAPFDGLKRVLLVVDGSDESTAMISCMSTFPIPHDAECDILHVAPPIPTKDEIIQHWHGGFDITFTIPLQEIQKEVKKRAEKEKAFGEKLLEEATEKLDEVGIDAKSIMLRGDAATEIIQYAKENDVDLIICGGRGLGPIQSLVLGSVSRKLLHYAHSSVMVIKGKENIA